MADSIQRSTNFHTAWEWPIGIGALLILFGVIAILDPIATTIGVSWVIGALLLAAGLVQLVHAFRFVRVSHPGRVSDFFMGGLSIAAGAIVMREPIVGAVGVTAVIAFYLLVGAVAKMMMAFELHPARGWGYLLASSLVSFILGVALLVTFPTISLVVPGVIFGADLLIYGALSIGFALTLRKAQIEIERKPEERPENKEIGRAA